MNPEPQTHDSQPSIEIDWPSDMDFLHNSETYDFDSHLGVVPQNNDDLSALLDLDTCYSDSNAKTAQQSIEKPCLETQFTAEETQTRLIETTQSKTSATPPIADAKVSTPHPIRHTSELAIQETSVSNTREGEDKSKPEVESMQEIEVQLRFLRYKLQTGLLPTVGQPKRDEMRVMSLYLRRLEHIGSPPRSILRATRITKLLKKITNLDEIPRGGKFSFKERAVRLLEKWETSLEKEDPTRSSTEQPVKTDGTGLNAVTEGQQPAEQSTNDHNNESIVAPANGRSQPTPPPSPALQDTSKSTPERLVIDLTHDDDVDMTTGSEVIRQSTDQKGFGSSVAKSTQVPSSQTPSSINSEPISTTVRIVQAGRKSDSAKSNTKKRKRSDNTDDDRALLSASNSSAGKHSNANTPNRQRPQRKTSPGKHLTNEILWMSGSVSKIEKMIEDAEDEDKAIRKKIIRLGIEFNLRVKESEEARKLAERRKNELIELKEYLVAWGAQDEKVTDEWSSL